MKKMTKLSLVAALAVAGFSTANAKPLTEAIQDVEVSGTVVYAYNDYANGAGTDTSATANTYKIGFNLNSKINEDFKLYTRFLVADARNSFAAIDTAGPDVDPNIELNQVYFSYTGLKNTTVNIGKQGLTTPWTRAVDPYFNEQSGTGVLALSTWGPVTVAGAWFNQTNIDRAESGLGLTQNTGLGNLVSGSSDIYAVGVIGNMGPVVLDGWYGILEEVAPSALPNSNGAGVGFDTYTIGAKGNFELGSDAMIGFDARYVGLKTKAYTEALDDIDNSILKLKLSGKFSMFNASVMYAVTDNGKNGVGGGITALDSGSEASWVGWNMNVLNKTDADLWVTTVGVQAMEKLHIGYHYNTVDYTVGGNIDATEYESFVQVTYKISKNLMTYLRYGEYERDEGALNPNTIDGDSRGRVYVQYSF